MFPSLKKLVDLKKSKYNSMCHFSCTFQYEKSVSDFLRRNSDRRDRDRDRDRDSRERKYHKR